MQYMLTILNNITYRYKHALILKINICTWHKIERILGCL